MTAAEDLPERLMHRWQPVAALPAGLAVRDAFGRHFTTLGDDQFVTSRGGRCRSADLEFPITIERTIP